MTTRRDFLKTGVGAAAGIAFCSCGLLAGARAQQPARQKLPVTVGGKRVKTIDVHCHCQIPEANALLGEDGAKAVVPKVRGAEHIVVKLDQRLAAMEIGRAHV